MSRLFGPLRQMGFVVRDIDQAMRHWVEVCGIGPWYIAEKLPLHGFWYKEQRHDDIHLTIALANSGDVQLELIQQRDDTPSMYREFLAAGHEGLQHWSSWPENYHELLGWAVKGGWTIGQRGESPRGPFVYFLNEGHPGTVIEMAELTPTRRWIFDAVREAAVGWDGRDPIRHDWPHASITAARPSRASRRLPRRSGRSAAASRRYCRPATPRHRYPDLGRGARGGS